MENNKNFLKRESELIKEIEVILKKDSENYLGFSTKSDGLFFLDGKIRKLFGEKKFFEKRFGYFGNSEFFELFVFLIFFIVLFSFIFLVSSKITIKNSLFEIILIFGIWFSFLLGKFSANRPSVKGNWNGWVLDKIKYYCDKTDGLKRSIDINNKNQ